MTPRRLVIVDYSELFFTSIFAIERCKKMGGFIPEVEFLVMKKMFAYLKTCPDREMMLMLDGVSSWRKEIDPNYKGQRKEQREKYDIDWPDMFRRYAELSSLLDMYTPLNAYRDDYLESDDLIAVLAKQGHDIVAFSSDKDLNQLCYYGNIQLVSMHTKKKNNKYETKDIKNPIKELQKLIDKGDRADNIPKADSDMQRLINKKLVDLLNLPEHIEKRCEAVLAQQHVKLIRLEEIYARYPWKFIPYEMQRLWPQGSIQQ